MLPPVTSAYLHCITVLVEGHLSTILIACHQLVQAVINTSSHIDNLAQVFLSTEISPFLIRTFSGSRHAVVKT